MTQKKRKQQPEPTPAPAEATPDESTPDEPIPEAVDADADGRTDAAGPRPEEPAEPGPEPEPDPVFLLERERDEFKDRWLRGVAELENYRKRARKEVADSRRFAIADCLRDLLEVLDNFERAESALPADGGDGEAFAAFRQGMGLVHTRLNEILAGRGLEKIEAAPGVTFDPNFHEAVMQIESDDFASGEITDVAQTGYRIGDLVLRPSRVVVAR